MRISSLEVWLLPAALMLATPFAAAADLLYVYSKSCPSCLRFDRDVGEIYPRTQESSRAPMTKVTMDELADHPLGACIGEEVFGTPTFIMLNQCTELDRIVGYSTDELFWLGLNRMLNQLPD